jgi:ribosomal-protein-alanine N-acetyltransferase
MIEFKRLSDVKKSDIIKLMNHPKVRLHMPLAKELFDDAAYDTFIAAKEDLWKAHGYGPSAFYADGRFIGWGGLQYEEGNADRAGYRFGKNKPLEPKKGIEGGFPGICP